MIGASMVAFAALVAACGDGADDAASTSSSPAPTTDASTIPDTTGDPVNGVPVDDDTATSGVTTVDVASSVTAEVTTIETAPARNRVAADVPYLTMNGVDLALDVYATGDSGARPVVVAFHGVSPVLKDAETVTVVADAAAEAGFVVFVPSWITGAPPPIGVGTISDLRAAGSCAVAFAQESAAAYGGDPSNTVTYGFSAGTGPAFTTAVAPATTPIPGCATDASPQPVGGVVVGDGETFWESQPFDAAFAAELTAMQDEVAVLIDPTRWSDQLEAEFVVWAASEGTAPRPIDDPADQSGWLAQRDPDGSIRSDLDRLGAFDDDVIDYLDGGRLLELRLAESGFDVSFDEYPGGHDTRDKVPQLIESIAAASGEA